MLYLSKKSQVGLAAVIIVIIGVLGIGMLANLGSRECNSNKSCNSDEYCGSDFACHQIPVIEKTLINNNFIMPSIIVGIAIIMASFILKSGKLKFRPKKPKETDNAFTEEKTKLRTP